MNMAYNFQTLQTLVDGYLWEGIPWRVYDGSLEFYDVPQQDLSLYNNLEEGYLLSHLILSSVTIPFLGENEELGCI